MLAASARSPAERLDLVGDRVAQDREVGHRIGRDIDPVEDLAVVGDDCHADSVLGRKRDEREYLAERRPVGVERRLRTGTFVTVTLKRRVAYSDRASVA